MITPEFLQGCTDEQINMGVSWLKIKLEFDMGRMNTLQFLLCNSRLITPRPYCTNPNDAWPIMMSNDIDICRRKGVSYRRETIARNGLIQVINENGLRAVCEVYILMSNEK